MQAWIKGYANVGDDDKSLHVVFVKEDDSTDWLPSEIKFDGALVTLDYLEETLGVATAHSALDRALDNAWSRL